jgi:hypothetical protein
MADYPGVTRRPARKLVQYSLNQAQPSMRIFNAIVNGTEVETPVVLAGAAPAPVITRRALVAGEYVYFTGDPPPGASDIVIVAVTP